MELYKEALSEIKRNSKLKSLIAIRTGVDPESVEKIISGEIEADENFQNVVVDLVNQVRSAEKVANTQVKRFLELIIKLASDDKRFYAVFGPVGCGKTFVLRNVGISFMSKVGLMVIYYRVPEVSSGKVTSLLSDIYRNVGSRRVVTGYFMYQEIKERLLGVRSVLLIDEAQRLSEKQFEVIRDLWDEIDGLSIIMVGSFAFAEKIRRKELDSRDAMSQFLRRIDQKYILPGCSWQDVREILGLYGISYTRSDYVRIADAVRSWGDIDTLVKAINVLGAKVEKGEIRSWRSVKVGVLLKAIDMIKNYYLFSEDEREEIVDVNFEVK